ncbi:hypothetical protein F5884DRAFT_791352 [Xylogone sp. PMI_703]|nr:hypothetical protein F5884DRAFT_791352 [Xylogone sp. PMI_703]
MTPSTLNSQINASKMPGRPVFSPAMPIAFVNDPEKRIRELRSYLQREDQQNQKANILKLIEVYESGERKPLTYGEEIWVLNGEIFDKRPKQAPGEMIWLEVSY